MRVVVFTDPGLDDALALVWLLTNPEVSVEGIVAVSGNVSGRLSVENVRSLLSQLDTGEVPVYAAGDEEAPASYLPDVHGSDGLGGLREEWTSEPTTGPVAPVDDLGSSESTRVLCLAPCSSLAEWLTGRRTPPGRVVVMGGAVEARGNMRGDGEFNFGRDPGSAAQVLRLASRVSVVPLDVTRRLSLSDLPEGGSLYGDRTATRVFRQLADRYRRLARRRDAPACHPHDLLAAIALVAPDVMSWSAGDVSSEAGRLEVSEEGRAAIATGFESPPRDILRSLLSRTADDAV